MHKRQHQKLEKVVGSRNYTVADLGSALRDIQDRLGQIEAKLREEPPAQNFNSKTVALENIVDTTQGKEPKTRRRKMLPLVLGVATLVGGIPVMALLPRVVVSPASDRPGIDPFAVSFDITNANVTPLRDVGAMLKLRVIRTDNDMVMETDGITEGKVVPYDKLSSHTTGNWQHHNLGGDERFTIDLTDVLPWGNQEPFKDTKIEQADIFITVTYKPWPLPFTREKAFRFTGILSSGKTLWQSLGVNDTPPFSELLPPRHHSQPIPKKPTRSKE